MDRRKFILGLGSAAAGGSALLGSGAFSRVESQRNVTIEVSEDPDAYLGMDKCHIDGSKTPNSSYAHLDDHGHLGILMNDENPTIGESDLGEGINSDSRMWADNVFQLCNQGKEDVCVYIADDEDWPYAPEPHDDERRVDFYPADNREASVVDEDNEFLLPLGECLCIGLKTNSRGLSDGDELLAELDNEIRIIADVDCPEFPTDDPEDVPADHAISWVSFCVENGDNALSPGDISIDVTGIKDNDPTEPTRIEWTSSVEVDSVTLKGGQQYWQFEGGASGTASMGEGEDDGTVEGQSPPSPCPDGSCGVKFEWDDSLGFVADGHQDEC